MKHIQTYLLRLKLGFYLFFFCCFFFGGGIIAQPSTDISMYSSASFSTLKDIAHGLSGIFGMLNRKSLDNIVNINNQKDKLVVLSMGVKSFGSSNSTVVSVDESEAFIEPEITTKPLVYPNPFRQSTDGGAILSYDLSKDFSFEIHIYNMLSQRVFKQTFQAGSLGARKGPNRLQINQESLGGYLLSSGVYFYVFVHAQAVIGKGKMVVKP